MKTILDVEVIQGFIRMCNDGWLLGWHERNGGNLTYRMQEIEVEQCRPFFKTALGEWVKMDVQADNLRGEYFISTGSGKYMRNVILAPQDNFCIVQINGNGDSYRIVWGLEKGGRPTSEFPSHFLNHSVKKAANDSYRVIYHAHPANLIALTYVLEPTAKAFSRTLWQSATECPVVFPAGVGVVEWMVPGGAAIAKATSLLMETFDAIVWIHHGLFCAGLDFDTTFGLMHTIEKAAEIYVKVLSTGKPIRQTITDSNLQAIAHDFNVVINKDFF